MKQTGRHEASPPEPQPKDAGSGDSPGETGLPVEEAPSPSVDLPAITEAESAESTADFILAPAESETAVEGQSPSAEALEPPLGEAHRPSIDVDPPVIPPLPTDPARPLTEPGSAAVTHAEAPAESAPAPEPARSGNQESFAERAQMVISRIGELPTPNGAPKTRALPRVIAIANQKGGVGKTTTTVNLGAALSELDYRVLVVDLDPQGNATSGLGIDTRNFESSMYDVIMRDAPIEDCIEPTSVQNLFVTPATIDLAGVEIELVSAFSRELKLKRAIDTVVDDFDFVLIDCPPSLGLLTVNGLAAATEVLVPIQCEYYALEGLSQLLRNVQLVATNLNKGLEISAIVLTMFDARTRLAIDVADEVRTHFKEVVCRSIIPRTVRLSEAPSFGQPITVFDPSSRGSVAYRELAKEVSDGAPKRSG
ncbi:MAG TPA: AAA family ATPase [Acidimicrobiales bacterium]|nr:AAA family ATPase [Acidimicrobiales bacterium]